MSSMNQDSATLLVGLLVSSYTEDQCRKLAADLSALLGTCTAMLTGEHLLLLLRLMPRLPSEASASPADLWEHLERLEPFLLERQLCAAVHLLEPGAAGVVPSPRLASAAPDRARDVAMSEAWQRAHLDTLMILPPGGPPGIRLAPSAIHLLRCGPPREADASALPQPDRRPAQPARASSLGLRATRPLPFPIPSRSLATPEPAVLCPDSPDATEPEELELTGLRLGSSPPGAPGLAVTLRRVLRDPGQRALLDRRLLQGDGLELHILAPTGPLRLLWQRDGLIQPVPGRLGQGIHPAPGTRHWIGVDGAGAESCRLLALVGDASDLHSVLKRLARDVSLPPEQQQIQLLLGIGEARSSSSLELFSTGPFGLRPGRALQLGAWRELQSLQSVEDFSLLLSVLHTIPDAIDGPIRLELEYLEGYALRRMRRREYACAVLRNVVQRAEAHEAPWILACAAREQGRALTDLGCFQAAEEALERAHQLHTRLGDGLEAARDRLNRAWLRAQQREFVAAAADYEGVLEPAHQCGDKTLRIAALRGLGQAFRDLGHFAEARSRYLEARALLDGPQNAHARMGLHGDLGEISLAEGDALEALRQFELQRDQAEARKDLESLGRATANLGRSLIRLDRLEEACSRMIQTLPVLERLARQAASWLLYLELSTLERTRGRVREARAWLERIPPTAAEDVELGPGFLLEQARLSDAEILSLQDPAGIFRHRSKHERCPRVFAWEAAIAGIGRILDRLPPRHHAGLLDLCAPLRDGWLAALLDDQAPAVMLLQALEWSRTPLLLDKLHRHPRIQGGLPTQPRSVVPVFSPEALQAVCAPGEVVLEAHLLEDRLLWCKVRSSSLEVRVVPVQRRELLALRELLQHQLGARSELEALRETLSDLSRILLAPLRDWLDALAPHQSLVWIPPPELVGIPLHALPLPDDHPQAGAPLLTRARLSNVPSATALQLWRSGHPQRRDGTARILALNDPHGDLGQSGDEALDLRTRLLRLAGPTGLDWQEGDQATLDALRRGADTAKLLHCFCHGTAQKLIWRESSSLRAASPRVRCPTGPPLLPPTLRLAPQSVPSLTRQSFPELPVGTVGAADVLTFDLPGTLVCLWSCSSDQGQPGIAGNNEHSTLSHTFLQAGARAVIAAGWRAETAHTRALMLQFYSRLAEGGSTAAGALAEAQRSCLEELRASGDRDPDPRVWGVFSLLGDGSIPGNFTKTAR